jgi:site-specific recombinase XerD
MAFTKHNYKDNERKCFACPAGLPAFAGYAHLTYVCDKEGCRLARRLKFTKPRRMKDVAAGEITCQAPNCTNTVSAGRYMVRKSRFFCSTTCAHRHYESQNVVGTCLFCDGEIRDIKSHTDRQFCCRAHQLRYYTEVVYPQKAGVFNDVLTQYLEGAAKNNYKLSTWQGARTNLLSFLEFIQKRGVTELKLVKSKLITAYIGHCRKDGQVADNYLGHISTFFHWLEAEEIVTQNPVIRSIHKARKSPCAPRPFSDEQLSLYKGLIDQDESSMLKLAIAIGEESGLRIGEVTNIRLADINLETQQIFVRIPNKSDKPRQVPFGARTLKFAQLWLAERKQECPTDHLLHNSFLRPHTSTTLNTLIKSHLLIHGGISVPFSFHRLRHTWASRLINAGIEPAVLMELGGWSSWEAMKHYTKVLQTTIDRSYREAMETHRQRAAAPTESICSLLNFANIGADIAPNPAAEAAFGN